MSRVVIWPGTDPRLALLLEGVRRAEDGTVKSGWVINGAWRFEVRGNECLAKDSQNAIVCRWPKPPEIREVAVPDTNDGGYNDIIAWAEKQ